VFRTRIQNLFHMISTLFKITIFTEQQTKMVSTLMKNLQARLMINTCMNTMKKPMKTLMAINKLNTIPVFIIIINLPSLQLRKLIFQGEKLLMMTLWILHLHMDLDREILRLKLFKNVPLNNFKMKKCWSLGKLRSLV
jgi:hypothetical protein